MAISLSGRDETYVLTAPGIYDEEQFPRGQSGDVNSFFAAAIATTNFGVVRVG
jgi:hypothetical protein